MGPLCPGASTENDGLGRERWVSEEVPVPLEPGRGHSSRRGEEARGDWGGFTQEPLGSCPREQEGFEFLGLRWRETG